MADVSLVDVLKDMGVTVAGIVFGAIGAALGVAYSKSLSPREALAALLSGIVFGSVLPEVVVVFYELPGILKNFLSIMIGIIGMFIVPGIMRFGVRFRDDPIAAIKELKEVIPFQMKK